MKKEKTIMKKIVRAWVKPAVGRYVFGTNFQKGDYIPTPNEYFAKIEGGKVVQLDPKLIRSHFGWDRISEKRLKKTVVGSDVELFVNAEDRDGLKSTVDEKPKFVKTAASATDESFSCKNNEPEFQASKSNIKNSNSSKITNGFIKNPTPAAGLGFAVACGACFLFNAKKEGEVNKKVVKKSILCGLLGSALVMTGQIILKAGSNKQTSG